jgi:NAD(P)-dependent dehydrogenase (short-subunit alcohol dehydrogenase family)
VCHRLVAAGKPVILTSRDPAGGAAAAERLRAGAPGARVEVLPLDAASPASVGALAAAVAKSHDGDIDLLVRTRAGGGGWRRGARPEAPAARHKKPGERPGLAAAGLKPAEQGEEPPRRLTPSPLPLPPPPPPPNATDSIKRSTTRAC